ncbi:hypothetical protein NE865_01358 [Phthorimaea operculella]|nr:hypothetical protein NE865_01358 [Phthorimaea operculella]
MLFKAALSRRKESAAPLTEEREGWPSLSYPLAFVLRLRVLQIVCGISAIVMGSVAYIEERQKFNMGLGIPAGFSSVLAAAIVMGSVAYIEERQKFNMGLGIPAGFSSVLAAAVSIHTSRGWGGVQGLAIRAGAEIFLWASAVCLLIALVVQSCKTILDPPGNEYGATHRITHQNFPHRTAFLRIAHKLTAPVLPAASHTETLRTAFRRTAHKLTANQCSTPHHTPELPSPLLSSA